MISDRFGLSLTQRAGVWVAPHVAAVSYPHDASELFAHLEDNSFWFAHRNRCLVELFRRYPPGGAVWDIGGGNGAVALALQNAGRDVVLVEPSQSAAIFARDRGIRDVICASWHDLPIRPESIPAIGLFDVLEHVDDHSSFLASAYSSLQPGGRIYLTVPAYETLWSSEDSSAGHYRRYSPQTLGEALRRAGFAIECVSPFFFWLPGPLWLLRTLPSLFGIRGDANARTTTREHATPRGVIGRLFAWCMRYELERLARGKRMPVGTSLMCVAIKATQAHVTQFEMRQNFERVRG